MQLASYVGPRRAEGHGRLGVHVAPEIFLLTAQVETVHSLAQTLEYATAWHEINVIVPSYLKSQ